MNSHSDISTGQSSHWLYFVRKWVWLEVFVLVLMGGAIWWHYHHNGKSVASGASSGRFGASDRSQPVSVATVQQRDIRVTVNAIGTIAANNTAVVRARVDGELKAIFFKEGQSVQAGQPLAQIDPRPFQIALTQAQGTLARDQALLRNAQLDLQRYRDLLAKDAAPKQQADTQEALVQQLQGTVLSDQANVDNAQLQLSYTRVLAPISGLTGLKQADLGNIVHAADANGLVSITQTQPVNLVFSVPDVNLPRIRQQLNANTAMRVEARDRDQKTLLAEGRVSSTDNAIDTTTGTIRVKAQFANKDNSLFPNQFVNVRLQLNTITGGLAVPSAAVQRGAPGTFVYVAADNGVVAMRLVKAGAADGDWVAIESDLKAGDKVVTDGADRLRDGATVEVIAPSKDNAGAAKGGGGKGGGSGGGHHRPDGAARAASRPNSSTQ